MARTASIRLLVSAASSVSFLITSMVGISRDAAARRVSMPGD